VIAALGSHADGLAAAAAAARLARHGSNRLQRAAPASALRVLLDQLRSLVVALLAAALALSFALGDFLEAIAIGVVLVLNTLLGFWTELRARRAMEALAEFDQGTAHVLRDGRLVQIAADGVVPADVLELAAGQRVPADARLLSATDLRVVEAALTGESMPVEKDAALVLASDTPLADRRNMVWKGTIAVAGAGRAVVTATGAGTEIGRVGALASGIREERTPLERKLDVLGRHLAWLAVVVGAVIAALGALQGAPLGLVLELGIALAVAAVPEALPAVATIALAVGLHRMARRHALVRRLPSVESLGATTVVCTDKTRTLTSGEMTAVECWAGGRCVDLRRPLQEGDAAAVRAVLGTAALASVAQPHRQEPAGAAAGDPVDRAVRVAAIAQGLPGLLPPQSSLLPFTSERQLLARFLPGPQGLEAAVKGAPRRVLSLCDREWTPAGPRQLDAAGREARLRDNEAMAGRALRVLGVARGAVQAPTEPALRSLEFLGCVGLIDPPAEGVRETIARLRAAGMRTIMLTGYHKLTAETIGRQVGLATADDHAVDGRELDRMDDRALAAALDGHAIFSRISPEHKLRIVDALQARGEIVAMLGDGVNDAPALRRADVGVAMGRRGTDVAREAADIVLQDDRFATVAAAVEEGRVIYANIRKFVFYLFSCNVAEVMVLLGAQLAGWPHPLLPLQILWLNLVTDTFPALALALEPADQGVMTRPPRQPGEALLSRRFLGSIAFYGALITTVTLAAFVIARPAGDDAARTAAFMTLALAQTLHLGNARSRGPVLRPARALANPWALAAVALAVALQGLTVSVGPLADVLHVASLSPGTWTAVVLLALVPAVVGQTLKLRRSAARPAGPGRPRGPGQAVRAAPAPG
jgi:Ca2+-transporting ATPase